MLDEKLDFFWREACGRTGSRRRLPPDRCLAGMRPAFRRTPPRPLGAVFRDGTGAIESFVSGALDLRGRDSEAIRDGTERRRWLVRSGHGRLH
jgi:hypothetical protein